MLAPSSYVWGDFIFREADPDVSVVSDAYFVQMTLAPDSDTRWGVYDRNGRLVEAAAQKRGPGRNLIGQSERVDVPRDVERVRGTLIYGGSIHHHFGHYLLGVLPRYWLDAKAALPGAKILVHTKWSIAKWLALPFIRDTLGALGFGLDDFVTFEGDRRIQELIVPAPAMIEQHSAHSVLGGLGKRISGALIGEVPRSRSEPVYLSKERLGAGVWSCANEAEMADVLRAAGIRVVHPELLPLSEQLKVFAEHETVLGLQGSALHLSMLSPGPNRIIALGYDHSVMSNFHLIDRLKSNTSSYWHPEGGMEETGASAAFHRNFRLQDPAAIGKELLRMI